MRQILCVQPTRFKYTLTPICIAAPPRMIQMKVLVNLNIVELMFRQHEGSLFGKERNWATAHQKDDLGPFKKGGQGTYWFLGPSQVGGLESTAAAVQKCNIRFCDSRLPLSALSKCHITLNPDFNFHTYGATMLSPICHYIRFKNTAQKFVLYFFQ